MNPHDLTGRDLDLAVARALGYVWWAGSGGFAYQMPDDLAPDGWQRIDRPPPDCSRRWLPGYDCDGGRIHELFAEIAARSGVVELVRLSSGQFVAICREKVTEADFNAEGSTPNEALARLLLLVVER